MTPYERLAFVTDLAASIPPDQLVMTRWTDFCGSPGCIIGHAAMTPEMQNEGLTLRHLFDDGRMLFPFVGEQEVRSESIGPVFFGITKQVSESLFGLESKPRTLVARLKRALDYHPDRPA
jgi:hypothetical protein